MDHIYEEIKNIHHQRYRLSAAVISSIVFAYLITVFLLLTNSIVKNTRESDKSLITAQFSTKNSIKESTTRR